MRAFSGGRLGLGEVLKDQAFIRELVRTVQVLRKKERLNVTESIRLLLKSDKETEGLLIKYEKELLAGVGASRLTFGIKGSGKGSFTFEGKTVHIGFSRE